MERAGAGLYSVAFCGPGGCSAPGEWTPDTPIEGDPHYRVRSPGQLEIGGRPYARRRRASEPAC